MYKNVIISSPLAAFDLAHMERNTQEKQRDTEKGGERGWISATWVRERRGERRRRKEGADAQEAHLYAFPLITGRGQWLPLHNGFASASHLLPASLGEEEAKEEEEWGDRHQKTAG